MAAVALDILICMFNAETFRVEPANEGKRAVMSSSAKANGAPSNDDISLSRIYTVHQTSRDRSTTCAARYSLSMSVCMPCSIAIRIACPIYGTVSLANESFTVVGTDEIICCTPRVQALKI